MPYKLRKSPGRNLYWVVNKDTGRKHSKKPLPRSRAQAQMRALYAAENGYVLDRSMRSRSSRSMRGGLGKEVKFGTIGALGAAALTRGNPWAIGIGAATGVLATKAYPKEFH
jgi:hypothetical protein